MLEVRDERRLEVAAETQKPTAHRRDIDGLRAIAVTLVVLFHAGVPFLPGGFVGVDVFFVISGFLITGLLVREAQVKRSVSIANFYARRVRRLLPLATTVLLATIAASAVFMPLAERSATGAQINSAAMFYSNWLFAATSADYWAGGVDQSPVLHFWSLSIEEQYYVLIPILLIAILAACRRFVSWFLVRLAAISLVGITITSLALSILTTEATGPWAYFGLQTRAWELAIGGLIAISAIRLVAISALATRVLAWVGLLAIVASAVFMSAETVYPGSAALVPVLGTAAVLAAGCSRNAQPPKWLVSLPVVAVGLNSYAWYLWHWPMLIFGWLIFGTQPLVGATVVLLSFALAAITTRFIERPVRRSTWLAKRTTVSLLLGAVFIGTTVTTSWAVLGQPIPKLDVAPAADPVVSAPVQSPALIPAGAKLRLSQDPLEARDDSVKVPTGCRYLPGKTLTSLLDCNMGAPEGSKTVVLVGDSHAQSLAAGMAEVAKAHNWRLYVSSENCCHFLSNDCGDYPAQLTEQIKQLPQVDLVFVSRYADQNHTSCGQRETDIDAIASRLNQLGPELAAKTVIIRDAPEAPFEVSVCLRDHPDDVGACSFDRTVSDRDLYQAELEGIALAGKNVRHLDISDLICPKPRCSAVARDGTVIYRDDNHITARFSLLMWKALESRVVPLLSD